ncbi:MAG: hypothetical protein COA50_06835 [Flavobacteriaceae bacterium]|nr:MAG: hypothetical protein COA50_06835 [Flavobacteriaceae bacterium]
MKIYKAFLLTLLLLIFNYIPQFGFIELYIYTDLIGKNYSEHFYLGVVLTSVISYLIVFYYYWKPRPNLKAVFNYKQLDFSLLPYLLLIVFGLGLAEQPLFDFDKIVAYYRTAEIKLHSNEFVGFTTSMIYYRIYSLLVAPLFEELFFRKFLFHQLLKNNKVWAAILISSVCFSAIHFETPKNLIPTFIYGIIACLIYLKTKNIVYLIALHFLYNLCTLLCFIYGEPFFDWVYSQHYGFMYWALFIFGILITILGVKKMTSATKPQPNSP